MKKLLFSVLLSLIFTGISVGYYAESESYAPTVYDSMFLKHTETLVSTLDCQSVQRLHELTRVYIREFAKSDPEIGKFSPHRKTYIGFELLGQFFEHARTLDNCKILPLT